MVETTTLTTEPQSENPYVKESDRLKDPLNDRVVKDVPRPPVV